MESVHWIVLVLLYYVLMIISVLVGLFAGWFVQTFSGIALSIQFGLFGASVGPLTVGYQASGRVTGPIVAFLLVSAGLLNLAALIVRALELCNKDAHTTVFFKKAINLMPYTNISLFGISLVVGAFGIVSELNSLSGVGGGGGLALMIIAILLSIGMAVLACKVPDSKMKTDDAPVYDDDFDVCEPSYQLS